MELDDLNKKVSVTQAVSAVKEFTTDNGEATQQLTTEELDETYEEETPSNPVEPPSLAGKYVNEISNTDPGDKYNINDELTMWKNRIGLSTGRGLAANRLTNTLMGFNHRIVNNPVPVNREVMGLVFFTRPDMRLDEDNIANSRRFSDMAAQDRSSMDYSILAALDPMSPYTNVGGANARMGMPCHKDIAFDNLQAFIPLLGSQITNFSGIPDATVDNWLSEEGIAREQYGMADSTHEVNYGYSISTTFNNMIGDPIMRMMNVWLEWMSGVKMGKFKPKVTNSIQRHIDYQSRAYVIRFDPMGKILRFSCTGACWPQNDNAGSMATYDRSKAITADDSTLTIQWQAIGARHNDPLYMEAFNDTVAMFNPDMIADPNHPDSFVPIGKNFLRKLEPNELVLFNYYGYPHIDSVKRRLDWYVYQVDYEYVMKQAGLL